jgi:DNA invertase Pin-like site-specific DNA recombinase
MRKSNDTRSKVAAYIRVSTVDQGKGVASQKHAIKRYIEGHGIKGVKVYRDKVSGKNTHRPGFKRLQKAIFNGQVHTVICWKLDRLSRSLRDGINLLCDWLDRGVRIVAVSQQLDFSGPTGKMVASLLFAIAEMERENLRENTKRGLAAARDRGVKLGQPQKINPKVLARLLTEGYTMGAIADRLGVHRTTVYNTAEREGMDLDALRKRASNSPFRNGSFRLGSHAASMRSCEWEDFVQVGDFRGPRSQKAFTSR